MSETNERSVASAGSGLRSIPITVQQKQELIEGCIVDGFEYVSEETLYMDSHGVNVTLVIVQHRGGLFGFVYGASSEETIFDDYPNECVPMVAREVSETRYFRLDGKNWMDSI